MTDVLPKVIDRSVDRVVRRGVWVRRVRRFLTAVALLVMMTLIVGYALATDPARVRRYAEYYLSREVGGRVTIGSARLSIFEGLRLDQVRVSVSKTDPTSIFEAESLHVSYNPRALFGGRVTAERLVAVKPRVRLIEDLDHHRWNFQFFDRRQSGGATRSAGGNGIHLLPEVLVRNARFDYAQIQNGRLSEVGSLLLEGQFTPDTDGLYRFRVQSHGGTEGVFPVAEGFLKPDGSRVGLAVRDVEFVDEIKTILPAEVRRFWENHQLAGRLDQLQLDVFRRPDGRAGYRVQTDLTNVRLSVPPTTWMGPGDATRVRRWREAYTRLAGAALGGSGVSLAIIDSMTPAPLRLEGVDARFVFTEDRVNIERLLTRIDGNELQFSGHIDGYSADAGIDLRVQSPPGRKLVLNPKPAFLPAMPWPVQEIYYRFRPVGSCDLWLSVSRPAGVEQPQLRGELNVYDARFAFERIPYPVERATGKLRFGNDPVSGREMLEIVSVTGRGEAGGPNADARLDVRGTIAPLDETAGADLHVAGHGLAGEPRLIDSLPPLTRQAVMNFDANKTGLLPAFDADFGCDVHRAVGLGQPWTIVTKLDLRNGAGVFRGFPYPLHGVGGSITVYDDHVDVPGIDMTAGGGAARLTGAINWTRHDAVTREPLIQTDLTLRARDVPIDDALVNALPPSRRAFFARLGLSGRVDVDGRIEPSAPDSEEPSVDLKVKLTQGRLRPPTVRLKLDDASAAIRIKGTRVDVDTFDAKLAGTTVQGTASAVDGDDGPRLSLDADVAGLKAEAAPLDALPPDAARVVRSLHAKGAVDLHLHYGADDDYRVTMTPSAGLTMTPDLLPLPFDHFGGQVVVTPKAVTLDHVTANYRNAPVSVAGTVDPDTGDADLWLAGRDLSVTPAFVKALPPVLGEIATSLSLTGAVAIDCPKLVIRSAATRPTRRPASTSFEATLWLQRAAFQVSADLRDVVGKVSLTGAIEDGTLKALDGKLAIDDMSFAGRRVSRLNAVLTKQPDRDLLQLSEIEARVAGGTVAGRIDTMLAKKDPRFALKLLVRGAKLTDLTGDIAAPADGVVNASLDMEGRWNDTASRRGRGDVLVLGKNMVRVPLVFGLMQVANLALPNRQPISQAGLRYTIEGQRIRMDQIDLRSTKSMMQGDGMLDFDKKTVELNLALADSAADALPLFGPLLRNARQDLLRLHIRGSLNGPTDGGQAFNIFNSTVDEVKDGK